MSRCRTALQLMPVSDAVNILLHTRRASCPLIFMPSQLLLIADSVVYIKFCNDERLKRLCQRESLSFRHHKMVITMRLMIIPNALS